MKRDKFLILSIVILFVLNLFTLVHIFWGMHHHEGPPDFHEKDMRNMHDNGRPDDIIIDKLKLNDEQVKKFEELKREHHSQVEKLQMESKDLHDEYFGLLKSDNIDTVKASQVLEKISANQKQLDIYTFQHFEKLKNICDNSQKELFNTLIDDIAHSFKPPPGR